MKKILYLALIAVTALTLGSCRKSSVNPTPPRPVITKGVATLNFDWSRTANPTIKPKSMAVYFFPTDPTKTALKYHVESNTSVSFDLLLGSYKVVCLNDDVKNYLIRGEVSKELLEIVSATKEEPTFSNTKADGERLVFEADTLWSYQSDNIMTVGLNANKTAAVPVTLNTEPLERTTAYTITASNLPNTDSITFAYAGTLSGMFATYRLGSDIIGDEAATLIYRPHLLAGDAATGTLRTFGRADKSHTLTLYCYMLNRTYRKIVADVTSKVNTPEDPSNPYLIEVDYSVTPYTIEPYTPGEDGVPQWFDITLNPWIPTDPTNDVHASM